MLNGVQGVWDNNLGGFVYGPCHTPEEASLALLNQQEEYILADEDPSALTLAEYCPDHWAQEQPKDGCDECDGDPTACRDADGHTWPEHDFDADYPECRRCGAECED